MLTASRVLVSVQCEIHSWFSEYPENVICWGHEELAYLELRMHKASESSVHLFKSLLETSLVVQTPWSQCMGPGFSPGLRGLVLHSSIKTQHSQKKKGWFARHLNVPRNLKCLFLWSYVITTAQLTNVGCVPEESNTEHCNYEKFQALNSCKSRVHNDPVARSYDPLLGASLLLKLWVL